VVFALRVRFFLNFEGAFAPDSIWPASLLLPPTLSDHPRFSSNHFQSSVQSFPYDFLKFSGLHSTIRVRDKSVAYLNLFPPSSFLMSSPPRAALGKTTVDAEDALKEKRFGSISPSSCPLLSGTPTSPSALRKLIDSLPSEPLISSFPFEDHGKFISATTQPRL